MSRTTNVWDRSIILERESRNERTNERCLLVIQEKSWRHLSSENATRKWTSSRIAIHKTEETERYKRGGVVKASKTTDKKRAPLFFFFFYKRFFLLSHFLNFLSLIFFFRLLLLLPFGCIASFFTRRTDSKKRTAVHLFFFLWRFFLAFPADL